jgi:hypothetical protein
VNKTSRKQRSKNMKQVDIKAVIKWEVEVNVEVEVFEEEE